MSKSVLRNSLGKVTQKANKTPGIICPSCGKKSKDNQAQTQQVKIHADKSVQKNYISTLKRSQQYARAKEDFENKNIALFEAPEEVKHRPQACQHIHQNPVPLFQVNFLLLLPAPTYYSCFQFSCF